MSLPIDYVRICAKRRRRKEFMRKVRKGEKLYLLIILTSLLIGFSMIPKTKHTYTKSTKHTAHAEKESLIPQAYADSLPTVTPLPTNYYKNFIYQNESGNDPTRWNSSGCLGLGQACPASKLLAVCPNEDYSCEDQWFTNYMLDRYGSWEAAYEFWITKHFTNGIWQNYW